MTKLDLPNGSLMIPERKGITPDLLGWSGLFVQDYFNESRSFPKVENDISLELAVLRPQEGVVNVLTGTSDLTITGGDWVREIGLNPDYRGLEAELLCDLDYGQVSLVPVVRQDLGVEDFTDFLIKSVEEGVYPICGVSEKPFLAAQLIYDHVKGNKRLRDHFGLEEPIIKFPVEVGAYVDNRNKGLVILKSEGRTEDKIVRGEYAGDKVHWGYEVEQSGETIKSHGLKVLETDTEKVTSEAGLYAGPSVAEGTDRRWEAEVIRDLLSGARELGKDLRRDHYVPVGLAVPSERVEDLEEHIRNKPGVYRNGITAINPQREKGYVALSREIRAGKRWEEMGELYRDFDVVGFNYLTNFSRD